MPRIFYYKMTDDTGLAPCVDENLLTLAVCKPDLRIHAELDDIVIGFGDKKHKERLIFVAGITGKLHGGGYYRTREYQKRRDCIYEDRGGKAFHRPGQRVQGHDTQKALLHDVGASFERGDVLISECGRHRYLGKDGTKDYCNEHKQLARGVSSSGCRPYRVNHTRQVQEDLERLIAELLPATGTGWTPGVPSDPWPGDSGGCGQPRKPKRSCS
jgi:hypothetical protein